MAFQFEVAYLLFVFIVCGILTFKARNLPANYNETRYITYAMFLCSILMIFAFLVHESIQNIQRKTFIINLTIVLVILVFLVVMYGPKIWIILFYPELNTNKKFMADRAKDINKNLNQQNGVHNLIISKGNVIIN